jgi:hypothetical protein
MTSQAANYIVISANGGVVNNTTATSCVVYPIRNDNTQTSSVRVHWNTSTYELSYGNESSAARYKKNVQLLEDEFVNKFEQLEPKQFVFVANNAKGIGFIAEDVEEAGLSEFVTRDPVSGEITGLVYEHMVAPLLKLVQRQKQTVENQKVLIENLQSRIEFLES